MTRILYDTPYRLRQDVVLSGHKHASKGDIVYKCKKYDYGCANDDTRYLNIEHVSVTLREDGDYPFFTAPVSSLESPEVQ